MADPADGTASTLNELIHTCKDSEDVFQSAALLIEDLNLRRLFESYAQQRAEFAAGLQLEVRRLAVDPVESGHASEALHRSWADIKAGVTGRDDGAVIVECERSEDLAIERYQETLEAGLPSDLRMIVERQLLEVKQARDHVGSLARAHSRCG